ncbi:MAG: flagellar motor protein MotB [Bryobacteraceae bacterium]
MIRRTPHPRENHERWMVSYADFVTLLFAFFVVMFASTQADKAKAREVSASVREALAHGEFSAAISNMLGRGRHDKHVKPEAFEELPISAPAGPMDLTRSMETLSRVLDTELRAGKVGLKLEARGLVISLRESGFFASGEDVVSPASFPTLEKIADVIQDLPNPVRLEGHTDSIPIHNSRFRSNWELSAARAIAMLEILATRYQIPRARMAVAGYAENAAADTNETDEGRAHNRRVDVVLLTVEGLRSEPRGAQ